MTSQINPESNNYDAAYPVAGQDNNTIGFRQNFASIQENFQYAKDEITALQTNTVQAGGNVFNDLNGAVLYDTNLQNQSYAYLDLSNSAPTANVNYAVASFQELTANGNTTVNLSNIPAAGNTAIITLSINATAANAVAIPYSVSIANVNAGNINTGIIGLSGSTFNFPRTNSNNAGVHTYQLITSDQGSTFTVTPLNTLTQPFNASSEDVANVGVVNLGVSDSYFSTSGAETATLPAGVNGQVKVLAMNARVGNMVITVTNPGWGGAGTITFNDVGDACTLKYINSKWFCIGNNGCIFA
jgi:hypothetical protein